MGDKRSRDLDSVVLACHLYRTETTKNYDRDFVKGETVMQVLKSSRNERERPRGL